MTKIANDITKLIGNTGIALAFVCTDKDYKYA